MKKRLLCVIIVLVIVAVIAAVVFFYRASLDGTGDTLSQFGNRKETIHLWYTDDALTDYLNSKALEFYGRTDIRVDVRQVSGREYLEAVNAASLDEETDTPDLYILSNDSLEKAYLAGLATQLPDTAPVYEERLFTQSARNAVMYNGKYVACPMYYETSALLYNRT
ncbi:MAG: sugar ABC transporter substrate-binding protein, partial [Lachnospiraceae bacterium]|nr:sugar ABC transporter substrate-binding protein [Lachnospiraceae bacterium]